MAKKLRKGTKPFMYADIFSQVREAVLDPERPEATFGSRVRIAVITDGERHRITNRAYTHRIRIRLWINKWWPLDLWRIYAPPMANRWKGHEIWVEFVGIAKTPKEAWDWWYDDWPTTGVAHPKKIEARRKFDELVPQGTRPRV